MKRMRDLKVEVEHKTLRHGDGGAEELKRAAAVGQLAAEETLTKFRVLCRRFLARTNSDGQ